MYGHVKILLALLLAASVFCSCVKNAENPKNTGILADKSVVSSIKQELEDRENSLLASEGDVFWTPAGRLWHSDYKCPYLVNSKTVYHGTLEEARLAGKQDACKHCAGVSTEYNDEIYSELEGAPITTDDVFFNKDSLCWHTDINCSLLNKNEKVYHADISTARTLGKISGCTECENNK